VHAPGFFPSLHLIVWGGVVCCVPSAALAVVVKTGLAVAYSLLDTMATWLVLLMLLLPIVFWHRPFCVWVQPYVWAMMLGVVFCA